jgi:hypothetical protein
MTNIDFKAWLPFFASIMEAEIIANGGSDYDYAHLIELCKRLECHDVARRIENREPNKGSDYCQMLMGLMKTFDPARR